MCLLVENAQTVKTFSRNITRSDQVIELFYFYCVCRCFIFVFAWCWNRIQISSPAPKNKILEYIAKNTLKRRLVFVLHSVQNKSQ